MGWQGGGIEEVAIMGDLRGYSVGAGGEEVGVDFKAEFYGEVEEAERC